MIFHPDEGLSKRDRRNAWISTIMLGIFTAGTVHLGVGIYQLGCKLYNRNRVKVKKENSLNTVPGKLFTKNTPPVVPSPPIVPSNPPSSPINPPSPKPISVAVSEAYPEISKILKNKERAEPTFDILVPEETRHKIQPDIQKLLESLPPAYYNFQIWGAKRKNPIVLQGAVENIKDRFKDTEGNFENKLPIVIVIFRNSDNSGVEEPIVCKEEELEEIRKMGIVRIVAMNLYKNKIVLGTGFDKAVVKICEGCKWWESMNPSDTTPPT